MACLLTVQAALGPSSRRRPAKLAPTQVLHVAATAAIARLPEAVCRRRYGPPCIAPNGSLGHGSAAMAPANSATENTELPHCDRVDDTLASSGPALTGGGSSVMLPTWRWPLQAWRRSGPAGLPPSPASGPAAARRRRSPRGSTHRGRGSRNRSLGFRSVDGPRVAGSSKGRGERLSPKLWAKASNDVHS